MSFPACITTLDDAGALQGQDLVQTSPKLYREFLPGLLSLTNRNHPWNIRLPRFFSFSFGELVQEIFCFQGPRDPPLRVRLVAQSKHLRTTVCSEGGGGCR